MSILLSILFAVLGGFIGLYLSKWDTWLETSKRSNLKGEWHSITYANDHTIIDKVVVKSKRGKFYIQNIGNNYGYTFEVYCTISSNNIMHGTWRSTRLGSFNSGRILMLLNPQGNTITGVATSRGSDKMEDFILVCKFRSMLTHHSVLC